MKSSIKIYLLLTDLNKNDLYKFSAIIFVLHYEFLWGFLILRLI